MPAHRVHDRHDHQHKEGCGHRTVDHDGHRDYVHDGHLHYVHGDHCDEHAIAVSAKNPDGCTTDHDCRTHPPEHRHGPGCGHEAIPHGDHVDYVVRDHLHHPHDGHCDDHGAVVLHAI